MSHELGTLFSAALLYLLLLFLLAYVADRGLIPDRWIRHPLTYTLSLGVYATSWSYYGSVGFAETNGFQFLTVYLGVTLAFTLSPVLLRPILRLTQEYQLSSLADLFAFRYRSQAAGILVTLFMLVGTLPYIALQIRAVTESLQVLTHEVPPQTLAMGFCITLTLFAILFGARHTSPREKHRGLVVAIAFESLVKLLALLLVGAFALFGVFQGPGHLSEWLQQNPEAVRALYRPMQEGPWFSLLFLSFAAAFLLPRQFHMLFAENLDEKALATAAWAFPLFLFLMNLPIPVVLWAGHFLELGVDPDYYVLGITLIRNHPSLSLLAFIGGVSAASAMVIVTTLALSSMSLNHLLLPISYPDPRLNLYYWLLWGRRLLIGIILLAGYSFYALLEHSQGLVQLGLISFVAVAQFLPGILGLLYWRRATRDGFIAGLVAGILVWAFTLLIPLLHGSGLIAWDFDLARLQAASGLDKWSFATFWSLSLNSLFFFGISLLTRQSPGEQQAAQACCTDAFIPITGVVSAASPAEFASELGETLGRRTAQREVQQALADLGMAESEHRPTELRRLREQIERNLSGLLGPQLAHIIVSRRLALDSRAKTALADSMRYVEERLEQSRSLLDGLTAELDRLRRYQHRILADLPLGVCSVSEDLRVVLWNLAMELCSKVPGRQAVGAKLNSLPKPWNEILTGFARASDNHIHHLEVEIGGRPHWFNLHKADIEEAGGNVSPGLVILVEDLTHMEYLEAELTHSDRLASIGRLAAGVAHEIGNPLTGIASLAQNLEFAKDNEAVRARAQDILTQTRRISNIVQSLMNFSRSGNAGIPSEPVRVSEMLNDALQLIRLTHQRRDIRFDAICPDDLCTRGDRQRLSQVFMNLLSNAGDASVEGGRIDILASERNGRVLIEILDQGCGIPPNIQERLFEPFTTTKPTGKGTGLGLALARNIILDHGGTIEIDSAEGVGTRVIIDLPQAEEAP
ncbi:MAG: PAS domain-containing protein [Gammaproteobacteria bacterium]|nr:PAS domain-containing protein [Gammaproteobacteria bacterium]MBU1653297.1 PAS domain-containing protein [Gammaproteobacteria bacterium]MBU1962437.1 PAS domain-containing protein [Gammaproteobacteria bacterium]